MTIPTRHTGRVIRRAVHTVSLTLLLTAVAACAAGRDQPPAADLILYNGRVYSLTWPEPSREGVPSAQAPYDSATGWHHDATAVAVREGRVVFVGNDSAALARTGARSWARQCS